MDSTSLFSEAESTDSSWAFEQTESPPIVLRPNCSIYNPCGSRGRCKNNFEGEWKCICKFWWSGTTCDELTSSGTQVIIVGSLLGLLMIIFHSLEWIHQIRRRRRRRNQTKSDASSTVQPLPSKILGRKSKSFIIQSVIVAMITILLTISTLVGRWFLLKSVHERIVEKYYRKEPLFFERHSFCSVIDLRNEFNIITFPVACLLIIIFSLTTKRKSFQRDKGCRGYIGLPVPLDFFAQTHRTFSAVIFSISADELLEIFSRIVGRNSSSSNEGIMITYLRQIFKVIVIGCRYYPTLAAVHINTSFALICASLYSCLDFAMIIFYGSSCRNEFYPSDKSFNASIPSSIPKYFKYYGTGNRMVTYQFLSDIPRYLFLSYICVKLFSLVVARIRDKRYHSSTSSYERDSLLYSTLPESPEYRHVRKLFGIKTTPNPIDQRLKWFHFIYRWRDDFRFSSRIVCVYAVVLLLLFYITVEAMVRIPPSLGAFRESLQSFLDLALPFLFPSDTDLQADQDPSENFLLPNFERPYFVSISFTLLITIVQLLFMLASIRRNMIQAFRGEFTEIPSSRKSRNVTQVVGNFRFAGVFIGYVILAFIFLGFFTFLIAVIFATFVSNGGSTILESVLKSIIPIILLVRFKMYLNRLIGQYVFLQHKINVLSLNNRRVFMIFLYFNIFLDAFLGLVAALIRILKSAIGGILFMCRLDYSPLGRKLETSDAGFNAYCSFIHVECAHRHPVLLCFMSFLLRDYLYPPMTKKWSKARHKWSLAIFLINNPTLIYKRKHFKALGDANQLKIALIGRENLRKAFDYNEIQSSEETSQQTNVSHRF